ncbi:RBM34 protein, partial [Polyodon spathula]|nr:RBM34 protein [Polyodon spathula]
TVAEKKVEDREDATVPRKAAAIQINLYVFTNYILALSTDAAQLALKLDNSVLMGRKIRVKRSVKKEKESQNQHKR